VGEERKKERIAKAEVEVEVEVEGRERKERCETMEASVVREW
jgi:hypothetical protein